MTPIAVPLLIRGEYNRLRKPRARAISRQRQIRLDFGVGDLHGLAGLRPCKVWSVGNRAREPAFQQFVRSRVDRGECRQVTRCRRQTGTPPVEKPPISLSALATMASNTGCTSEGELAMTFNISAVAACCSRASFRSLLGSETERRLTRVAAGAMRGLVLVVLRPFAGLALRAFASLVLPPVLDGRAISAPRVKKGILSG